MRPGSILVLQIPFAGTKSKYVQYCLSVKPRTNRRYVIPQEPDSFIIEVLRALVPLEFNMGDLAHTRCSRSQQRVHVHLIVEDLAKQRSHSRETGILSDGGLQHPGCIELQDWLNALTSWHGGAVKRVDTVWGREVGSEERETRALTSPIDDLHAWFH
jgi:hypothetical protein